MRRPVGWPITRPIGSTWRRSLSPEEAGFRSDARDATGWPARSDQVAGAGAASNERGEQKGGGR